MNKKTVLLLCLCALLCSCTQTENNTADTVTVVKPAVIETVKEKAGYDDTVYVLTEADGSVRKVIVSDSIASTLSETSSDSKVFDLQGNALRSEKSLPVDMSVSFTLDGNEISPEELKGRSGNVSIRFDFENTLERTAVIDGNEESLPVPFAVLTAMILDNTTFRNVHVRNGRFIDDGDHTAVVAVALCGLQDDLGISKDVIDIPDCVEITADVTDFEFGMTLSVVTNRLFRGLDLSRLDTESLTGPLRELTDGFVQLYEGSSALHEGTVQLRDGAGQLSEGLATLESNNEALNGGARQVFETLLSTAQEQILANGLEIETLTVENYAQVLDQTIASLEKPVVYSMALEKVREAVEENRPLIIEKVTEAVREQVEEKVTEVVDERASTGFASLFKGIVMSSSKIKNVIQENTDQQMETEEVQAIIAENVELQVEKLIEENMQSEMVLSQLQAAEEGRNSLIGLRSSLDSYNEFYLGLQAYTDGVAQASDGARALSDGAAELESGAKLINMGLQTIYDEVIGKVISFADDRFSSISSRLKAISEICSADDGQVFIYRTDEIL